MNRLNYDKIDFDSDVGVELNGAVNLSKRYNVVQILQKGIKQHMKWYFVVRKQEEQVSFRATDPVDLYSRVAPHLMSIFSCTKYKQLELMRQKIDV